MLDGENILSPDLDLNLLRSRVGMVFQKPTPFPMTIYDNIAFGIRLYEKLPKSEMDARVESALAPRRAVERGEGQAERERLEPFGRPAAAPVHRPHRGDQPGSDPVRRASLGARPDLDRQDRGIDRRIVRRLHDRDRHPQHAAGARASRATRPSCIWARWSNSTTPTRSSPRRATSARRITSLAASAEGGTCRGGSHTVRGLRQGPRPARAPDRRDGRHRRENGDRRDGCARPPATRRSPNRWSRPIPRLDTLQREIEEQAIADDRAPAADGDRLARDHRRDPRRGRSRAGRGSRQEHRQALGQDRRRIAGAARDRRHQAHERLRDRTA